MYIYIYICKYMYIYVLGNISQANISSNLNVLSNAYYGNALIMR